MSFAFLPRSVAKFESTPRPRVALSSQTIPVPTRPKEQEKESLSGDDLASLIHLSLSEYTLWFDSDLSRRLADRHTEGFLPLSYLCKHSQFLCDCDSLPLEVVIVKAVRARLDTVFEFRILVSSPLGSDWHEGSRSYRKEEAVGGYEIRRRDWQTFSVKVAEHNKRDWDAKTIYVEKLPPQFRSIAAICRFVETLLGEPPLQAQVQNITLPPHHLDRDGAQPKPRGFAFVTLLSLQSVEFLLTRWPWIRRNINSSEITSPLAQEALKFGFRAIPRMRWEELKEEYLTYREQLLQEIASSEESNTSGTVRPAVPQTDLEESAPPSPPQLYTQPSLSYPSGCLIFVRNIHPETNKTTLRSLFTSAVGQGQELLDYVDFNKGMDSCFLRVADSKYGQILVDHFAAHCIIQSSGLDGTGAPGPSPLGKVITMELVLGKKEELYWNKVPEKVCRQAVQRASQRDEGRHAKKTRTLS